MIHQISKILALNKIVNNLTIKLVYASDTVWPNSYESEDIIIESLKGYTNDSSN